MNKVNEKSIARWMRANLTRFVEDGEVNHTLMVETWDIEVSDGSSTLDPLHPAWDVAVEVAGP